MRLALFSDIHGNLEALETAVSYSQKRKVDKWIVLGDTVGYGAEPNACLEWALDHASLVLMGNHEKAVVDPSLREWFNPEAREAIIWTEGVLKSKLKNRINDLQYVRIEGDLTFAHGSPDDARSFRYLMTFDDTLPSFRTLENSVCFVGHTHVPCCFCEGKRAAEHLKPGITQLSAGDRYIFNPGSVGQPRDFDSRLSFAVFDTEQKSFELIRLSYDKEKAAQKIRKAGLPVYLADRLL